MEIQGKESSPLVPGSWDNLRYLDSKLDFLFSAARSNEHRFDAYGHLQHININKSWEEQHLVV